MPIVKVIKKADWGKRHPRVRLSLNAERLINYIRMLEQAVTTGIGGVSQVWAQSELRILLAKREQLITPNVEEVEETGGLFGE